jgi:hypothetical protein
VLGADVAAESGEESSWQPVSRRAGQHAAAATLLTLTSLGAGGGSLPPRFGRSPDDIWRNHAEFWRFKGDTIDDPQAAPMNTRPDSHQAGDTRKQSARGTR